MNLFRCAAFLLVSSLCVACSDDAEPQDQNDGGSGGEGTGGRGGGGGSMAHDPLGLASCDVEPTALPNARVLPVSSWAAPQDADVMCNLQGLEDALGDASIVCLGENSHGVSESTRWYAHLIRYLVHQRGVRTIAMEVERAHGALVTSYVRSGDPAKLDEAFASLGASLLNTVEARSLAQALAQVQTELPEGEQLTVTGFDVAVQPALTRQAVLDYLGVVAPSEVATWSSQLPQSGSGATDWEGAGQAALDLAEQLTANKDAYVAQSDEQQWNDAMTDTMNLHDGYLFLSYYYDNDFWTGDATHREPGMIRNVTNLRAQLPSDEMLVLTSHNGHCTRDRNIGTTAGGQPSPALGTHLATEMGSQYKTIGQLYMQGTENTINQGQRNFSSAPNALETAFGNAGVGDALLVGTYPNDDGETLIPFDQSYQTNWAPIHPGNELDFVLWLRQVTATTIQ